MVGVHAAFTCRDDTLGRPPGWLAISASASTSMWPRVPIDADAAARLAGLTDDRWLLVHGVHLADDHGLAGTIVHNPRSNMNNAVGYARPARFTNPVALGTDGIGAAMLDEFRLAFARHPRGRRHRRADAGLALAGRGLDAVPRSAAATGCAGRTSTMEPWALAYTTDVRPLEVAVDGEVVLARRCARPASIAAEIRAKAAEAAARLATG